MLRQPSWLEPDEAGRPTNGSTVGVRTALSSRASSLDTEPVDIQGIAADHARYPGLRVHEVAPVSFVPPEDIAGADAA